MKDITEKIKHLIEQIKQKRKLLGWSLKETSEKFELTTTGYAKIENGETSITIERLYQINEVFDVPIGVLLGIEEDTEKVVLLKQRIKDLEVRLVEMTESKEVYKMLWDTMVKQAENRLNEMSDDEKAKLVTDTLIGTIGGLIAGKVAGQVLSDSNKNTPPK